MIGDLTLGLRYSFVVLHSKFDAAHFQCQIILTTTNNNNNNNSSSRFSLWLNGFIMSRYKMCTSFNLLHSNRRSFLCSRRFTLLLVDVVLVSKSKKIWSQFDFLDLQERLIRSSHGETSTTKVYSLISSPSLLEGLCATRKQQISWPLCRALLACFPLEAVSSKSGVCLLSTRAES